MERNIHDSQLTRKNQRDSLPFQPIDRDQFYAAMISSDTDILLLWEIDERFGITCALDGILQDSSIVSHTQHSYVLTFAVNVSIKRRAYEYCNDAKELRTVQPFNWLWPKTTLMRYSVTLVTI